MSQLITKRFQLVEKVKSASDVAMGQRLYFDDQPQLRTYTGHFARVRAIEFYGQEVLTKGPSGIDCVGIADAIKCTLVINVRGTENLLQIPLARIYPATGTGISASTPDIRFVLDTYEIDWTKSYVQLMDTMPGSIMSFCFGVFYDLLPEDNKTPQIA